MPSWTVIKDDLPFLVMVDGAKSRAELMRFVVDSFPEALRRKSNSCDLRGNWLEIWANENADDALSADPETGYLEYRWRVEVTPLSPGITEAEQIELARALRDHLRAAGCKAVVCASFEDKLESS